MPRIYLDHAATAPILPEVRAAMREAMDRWANPSSPHAEGRRARAALESARRRVAEALDWPHDVIFTSGATEALGLALSGHDVAAGATEHAAVLRHAARLLPVDGEGQVAGFTPAAARVAIQQVNSETGVIQHWPAVRQHAGDAIWVCDASQSAGRLPLPPADIIVVSAHKLGGPPGMGALLVRDLGLLTPTGGQERGYRSGTENLPGAVGLATALEQPRAWLERAGELRAWLDAEIIASGGVVVGGTRLPTIASYRQPGRSASAMLVRCDAAGIAVSAGSACSSGSLRPSHVMLAMGLNERDAGEAVRVSIGPATTREELAAFLKVWRG